MDRRARTQPEEGHVIGHSGQRRVPLEEKIHAVADPKTYTDRAGRAKRDAGDSKKDLDTGPNRLTNREKALLV